MSTKTDMKSMECFFCRTDCLVDAKIASVLCDRCVARLSDPPELAPVAVKLTGDEKAARKAARAEKKTARLESKKTAKTGRGRGWHLKQLFEDDGQFYSFGKMIGDSEVAKIRKALKSVA